MTLHFYPAELDASGTLVSKSMANSCCVVFLPLVGAAATILFSFVENRDHQMSFPYTMVVFNPAGLLISSWGERSPHRLIPGLEGATLLLIFFHRALNLDVFHLMVGLGLLSLLVASWGSSFSAIIRKVEFGGNQRFS